MRNLLKLLSFPLISTDPVRFEVLEVKDILHERIISHKKINEYGIQGSYAKYFRSNLDLREISSKTKNTHLYPAKIFINVLFPAPEGPIIAVNSPDLKVPFTHFSMVL